MRKQRIRKRYESSFKARVALAAMKGDQTLSELASAFSVHGNLVSQWKKRLLRIWPSITSRFQPDWGRAR
jgi:transposase